MCSYALINVRAVLLVLQEGSAFNIRFQNNNNIYIKMAIKSVFFLKV